MPIYGYGYGNGWTTIALLVTFALSMYAQFKVKGTFTKYSKIKNRRNMTGKELAELMLRSEGIYDVSVGHVSGTLTDHYNPRSKRLNLSDSVYNSTSVAAIGVAAHECGHAIQHEQGYVFLLVRDTIVPVVNFSGQLAMPLFFIGLFLGSGISNVLISAGILLFAGVVVFQLITLPVELDASHRATTILLERGYLDEEEIKPAKKVLRAAALTYIAAAAASLVNLLRLIMISRGRRR